MILIADGGSTKTSWTLVDESGSRKQFSTEGYNPFYASQDYIVDSLKGSLPPDLVCKNIRQINFYGAGVHDEEKADIVKGSFKRIFINSDIYIWHDLLAAARALLGNTPGFAAILGTGTNTGIYNGKKIVHQIDSAGYIIGDEGSGCYIGLRILKDYIRDLMPGDLKEDFEKEYQITASEIMDSIYTQPFASRFAAGFSKFAGKHIDNPYCFEIVKSSFNSLFKELVTAYPDYKNYTFNCIGSVGYTFRHILMEAAEAFGMQCGTIISSPMDGLINYHIKK